MGTFISNILKQIRNKNTVHETSPFKSYLKQLSGVAMDCFASGKSLVLVYIDIKDFHSIERGSGHAAADRTLRQIGDVLEKKAPEMVPPGETILTVDKLLGDEFIVVYSYDGIPSREELQHTCISWHIDFKETLNKVMYGELGKFIDIHVGCAAISPENTGSVDFELYLAIREAQNNACGRLDYKNTKMLDEFRGLLEEMRFEIEYQPVVSLSSGAVLGWEALTRGPRDSHFRSPHVIFNFASEVDMLYRVERLCRYLAVKNLGPIGSEQKIFLNVNPLTIFDKNFVKGETAKIIQQNGLSHNNIVFEITEQADLRNLPHFKRALEHYREQGYMVAIDDMGAGFSTLQGIAQVRPDYIKIDMSLVRGVDADPVKKALIETFVAFAGRIGCFIIAEGIETENELRTLIKAGVHYGQGYHLGRPEYPKSFPANELCAGIARMSYQSKHLAWRHSIPVSDIMEECPSIKPNTLVRSVKMMIDKNQHLGGIVVTEGGKPVGLVMKQLLYGVLSAQYGVALYSNRPANAVMDRLPLVVEAHTPVETVAQVAMSRKKQKIYDHVIVTKNGRYAGVVTVQNLINSLTRIQLEFARGANPLTGLPGNNAIEEEIKSRLSGGEPFVLAYLDLDDFKAYNDRYGFDSGDRLLLFTSKIITGVCRKYGGANDFCGHLGGDDFVLVTTPGSVDEICKRIIRYFDRLAPGFYPEEDRLKKGIWSMDRNGLERWIPFVSISISLVECLSPHQHSINDISRTASSLKKFAKSMPGSVYVRDRRKEQNDIDPELFNSSPDS